MVAQLHPRCTRQLMSNIQMHHIQHAAQRQVKLLPVHSSREVVHLAYTTTNNNGSSSPFHRKSNWTSPRSVLAQNMRERCLESYGPDDCVRVRVWVRACGSCDSDPASPSKHNQLRAQHHPSPGSLYSACSTFVTMLAFRQLAARL